METPTIDLQAAVPFSAGVPSPRAVPPVTFAEMRLRVGDKIPLETLRSPGTKGQRLVAKVIGWFEGSSFLIALPAKNIATGLVKENEQVLMRAFTGKNAFAFRTTILKIEHFPFTYLHMSFPNKVDAVEIRTSFRHSVRIPVMISAAGEASVAGYILNIGMNGARIGTTAPLKDEKLIQLATQFELHDIPASLKLNAQVRSSANTTDEQGTMHYEYGVEFQDAQPNDRLILGSLLWYEMHAHPEGSV